METIISLLGGALAAGAVYGLNLLRAQIFVAKYGETIDKVFRVVDPIAGQLISKYDGSLVQDAIELAVARVADSTLDMKDLLAISKFVTEKFDVTKAASAVLDPESEEGKATLETAKLVEKLFDGASKEELLDLAKHAIALV